MDNDALMRRIAAATEAQKVRQVPAAPPPSQVAEKVQRALPTSPTPQGPSHLEAILNKSAQPEGVVMESATHAPTHVQPTVSQHRTPPPVAQAVPVQNSGLQTAAVHSAQHMQSIAAGYQPQAQPTVAPQAQAAIATPPQATSSNEALMSFRPGLADGAGSIAEPSALNLGLGILTACDGVNASIRTVLDATNADAIRDLAVGQMMILPVADSRVVGLVYQLEQGRAQPGEEDFLRIHLELQGEIRHLGGGEVRFNKGIAKYPGIGTPAMQIKAEDLSAMYSASGQRNVVVGNLSQDETIPAFIDAEAMLSKHFAVLGSTGCGKSSAVSLLLRASQEVIPDLRTIILDPHNEYASAFSEANLMHAATLDIPFWLFQLEEYAEVLFRGKPIIPDEIDALREFIPEAKQRFRDSEERTSLRTDSVSGALTADTPVPYRISDVLAIIDEEIGQLEARFSRSILKSLRARITAHVSDPRYMFMFRDKTISDKAEATLNNFFNLSGEGSLMTILQMSGMPSEVVNSVASVLCRLSFELCIAAEGKMKILMLCEEAHRYVPFDQGAGFEPTRRAIARIAKEGRKYGSFIGIVSQRPAELDPTILSQCSTVFSLRMSNEQDQLLIRKAIANSSKSTISFLSSLANREAIAFGGGLSTPMRLRFSNLPNEWLPGGSRDVFDPQNGQLVENGGRTVFHQWRGVAGASMSSRAVA